MKNTLKLSALLCAMLAASGAMAADWSSNSVGYRYAPSDSEPGVAHKVSKNILTFTSVSGESWAPTSSPLICSSPAPTTPQQATAWAPRNGTVFTSAASP
jgi:hypothetical protein